MVGRIEIRRQLDAQRAIHDSPHAADQSLRGLEVIPYLRLAGDVRTGQIYFDEIWAGASDRLGDLRKVVLAEARHACDHRLPERLELRDQLRIRPVAEVRQPHRVDRAASKGIVPRLRVASAGLQRHGLGDDGSGAGSPQRLELLARDAQGTGGIHEAEGKADAGDGAGKIDRVVQVAHCTICWETRHLTNSVVVPRPSTHLPKSL